MQDYRMETFLTVCGCLNYTQAAAALHITQPAVSQHIRYLEEAYGVRLFRQEGKRVQLTRAGELLKSAALTMKHDELHIRRQLQQADRGRKKYAFGATLTVAEYILPEDLVSFIRRHADSDILMYTANTSTLLAKLDAGELDFLVIEGDFPREEYDFFIYGREEYVAVADKERALRYAGAGVTAVLKERLITREKGSGSREIMEQFLGRQGIRLEQFAAVLELGNIGAMKEMVQAGLGISFLYKTAIRAGEGIYTVDIEGLPLVHEIMFVYRKGSIFKDDYRRLFKELQTRGRL